MDDSTEPTTTLGLAHPDPVSVHSDARVFHNYASTDDRKAFVSRVPKDMSDEELKVLIEQTFGIEVAECDLVVEPEEEKPTDAPADATTDATTDALSDAPIEETSVRVKVTSSKKKKRAKLVLHLGYGYVLLATPADLDILTTAGSVKTEKKQIIQIAAVTRKDRDSELPEPLGVCFLWQRGSCTHADKCKFAHTGEGGSATARGQGESRRQCFDWKKKGKCSTGDQCPFLHSDEKKGITGQKRKAASSAVDPLTADKKSVADKDCINWKQKGKCRKGEKCPYKHDVSVQMAALAKKKAKLGAAPSGAKKTEDAPAPAIPDNDTVTIRFVGGACTAMKRSEIESVLKSCDAPKCKKVVCGDKAVEVTFKSNKACEDAMLIMWNGVNRIRMGGDGVNMEYVQ